MVLNNLIYIHIRVLWDKLLELLHINPIKNSLNLFSLLHNFSAISGTKVGHGLAQIISCASSANLILDLNIDLYQFFRIPLWAIFFKSKLPIRGKCAHSPGVIKHQNRRILFAGFHVWKPCDLSNLRVDRFQEAFLWPVQTPCILETYSLVDGLNLCGYVDRNSRNITRFHTFIGLNIGATSTLVVIIACHSILGIGVLGLGLPSSLVTTSILIVIWKMIVSNFITLFIKFWFIAVISREIRHVCKIVSLALSHVVISFLFLIISWEVMLIVAWLRISCRLFEQSSLVLEQLFEPSSKCFVDLISMEVRQKLVAITDNL